MRRSIMVCLALSVAATAWATTNRERAAQVDALYAVPAGVQRVCEAGSYGCIESTDLDGNPITVCGTVVLAEDPAQNRLTVPDCLNQGGSLCTYPWDAGTCCGIQLGAPPPVF